MSDLQMPGGRKTDWGKVALGCGVAMLVSLVLAAGGAWWWFSTAFTLDPQEVSKAAGGILPGVVVPDGYEGALAMDTLGCKMVIIAPVRHVRGKPVEIEGPRNMFVIANYDSRTDEDAERSMRAHTEVGDGKVEELGKETITVGGAKVEFRKSRVIPDDGGAEMLQYLGLLPPSAGRQTTLMIMGPEASFDRKAMDAFLGSIK